MDRTLSSSRTWTGKKTPVATALILTVLAVIVAGGAEKPEDAAGLDAIPHRAQLLIDRAAAAYESTPPAKRVAWGGLAAATLFGAGVLVERLIRLRRHRILPADFAAKFLERLQDGRLDRGKALDFCELNASPASRVALAAVKRWGRPVGELERAVDLALRLEIEGLRRNISSLRRVAALTPLLGLLGTLFAASHALSTLGLEGPAAQSWGPALAAALGPLTAGVALGILALVAYDGLVARVETLCAALDRVGAETIDAVVLAISPEPRLGGTGGQARTPHQLRVEVPNPAPRVAERNDNYD
jgi:biopolymer transport protein ExbB